MEKASIKPGKFAVPENYREENIEENAEPWIEDLEDDDVEIWFMQAPPSVDLSKIQNMPINLSGKTYFKYEGLLGDKLESSAIPSQAVKNKGPQFSLIAPSKEDKKFRVVNKAFAGHILLTESFEVPLCSAPEETNCERSDYPEKLKQKHLFGSYFVQSTESPPSPKKKKKNKGKDKSSNSLVFSSSDAEIENVNNVENHFASNAVLPNKINGSKRVKEKSSSTFVFSSSHAEIKDGLDDAEDNFVSCTESSPSTQRKNKNKSKSVREKSSNSLVASSSESEIKDSLDDAGNNFVSCTESPSSSKKKNKNKSKQVKEKWSNSLVSSSSETEIKDSIDGMRNFKSTKEISRCKASQENIGLDKSSSRLGGNISEQDVFLVPKEKSKKKKKKREKHEESLSLTKYASSTENSDAENFKKPKSKSKIKEEPLSPVEDDYSSVENSEISKRKKKKKKKNYSSDDSTATLPNNEFMKSRNTSQNTMLLEDLGEGSSHSTKKMKKKKKRKDYSSDDSTATLPNNEFMKSRNANQNTLLHVPDIEEENSSSTEEVKKKKKKKKKIKEEPMSVDEDENRNSGRTMNTFIKQEERDSYDSSSNSKSVKTSSKNKKSRHSASKSSHRNEQPEEEEKELDTSPVSKVIVQGKNFQLNEELRKALKLRKKEKRKKLSHDNVKLEPSSP